MRYRVLNFGLLLLTWWLFSGRTDHLVYGVLSALLVTWMSSDLLFTNREMGLIQRIGQGIRMARYMVWLVWQIFLANLHILRLALSPKGMKEVQPTVVRYRTPLQSDFAKFLLANSITLTPGTVTARIEGDEIFVHAISRTAAEGIDGKMDRRIGRTLGEELGEWSEPESAEPESDSGGKEAG